MSIKYGENDTPAPTEMVYGANDKPADQPKASAIRKLGDLATGFGVGAIGATKAIADAAGAGNKVSGFLESANKDLSGLLSPQAIADQQEQAAIQKEAAGKGIYEEAKAGIKAFGVAPLQTTVGGVASMVPILAATALGGLPGAAAAGAAIGAGTAKGAIYDDIKARGTEKGLSAADAESAAATAQEYGGKNTDQIALGAGLGILDSATGASGIAGGMVRKALGKPVSALAAHTSERGILGWAGMGMLEEMPVEFAQGAQERVAANIAAQRDGYQANTWDNAVSGGTLEALASAGPGAGFGMMNGRPAPPAPGAAPSTAPDAPAPAPNAPQLGFNPAAGTMAVFPDGSTILDSESSNGAQAVRDMQRANRLARVGVADPAPNSPLTNAALAAVDSGAHDAAIAAQQATAGANASGQASMQGQPAPQNDLALPGAIPALPGGALQQSQSAGGSPQSPVRPLESAVSAGQGAPQTSSKAEAGAQAQTLQAGESGSSEIPTSASAQSKSSTPQTVSPSSSPIENPIVAAPAPTAQERLAALRAELDAGTDAKGAPLNDFTRGMRTAQIRSLITQLPKAEIEAARAKYDPAPAKTDTTTQAAPDFQVSGVDEAVKAGLGAITVSQGGKPVPFKDFSLLVHEDGTAEASVERASNSQGGVKGSGFGAYVALGNELAARGVKLVSGDRQHGPGKDLWARLTQAGYAQRQASGRGSEFVVKAAPDQATQQPASNSLESGGIKTNQYDWMDADSVPKEWTTPGKRYDSAPLSREIIKAFYDGNEALAQELADKLPNPQDDWNYRRPDAVAFAHNAEGDISLDRTLTVRGMPIRKWWEAVRSTETTAAPDYISEKWKKDRDEHYAKEIKKQEVRAEKEKEYLTPGNIIQIDYKTYARVAEFFPEKDRAGYVKASARVVRKSDDGKWVNDSLNPVLRNISTVGDDELRIGPIQSVVAKKPQGATSEPQASQAIPQQTQPEARAAAVASTPGKVAPAAPAPRPATWRTLKPQAMAVARSMEIATKGMSLNDIVQAIDQRDTDNTKWVSQNRVGKNGQPINEGGIPFKTSFEAKAEARRQAGMRVVSHGTGYALADKTAAQIEAEKKSARRLRSGQTSPAGQPIPAHAFIANEGGLRADARPDMRIGGNPRIGGRTLFAGDGKGIGIEKATARLIEEGYLLPGASHDQARALIKRSLNPATPQYNHDGTTRMAEIRDKAARVAVQAENDAQAEAAYAARITEDGLDSEAYRDALRSPEPEFEDYLAAQQDYDAPARARQRDELDWVDDDFTGAGFDEASLALQNEIMALSEQAGALGIDVEALIHDAHDTTASKTNQDYYELAISTLEAAIDQKEVITRGGKNSRQNDGQQGNAPAAGEGAAQSVASAPAAPEQSTAMLEALTTPTAQDIIDQQARAEAAAQAEKSQQRAADELARRERERKDIAKASTAAADTFELGGNAEQNLSGQQSVFDAPAAPADDLSTMFDDIMAETAPAAPATPAKAKTTPAKAPRTAAQAAGSAAKNTAAALGNAIDGLGALFGAKSKGRIGSGLSFDEDTYAQAKPLFIQAIGNLKDAAADIREAMRAVISMVTAKFGRETTENMKPYIVRFASDVRDGTITQEELNAASTNADLEQNSAEPAAEPAVGDTVPADARATADRAGEAGGQASTEAGRGQQNDLGLSLDGTTVAGERGDQPVHSGGQSAELEAITAGAEFSEPGGDSGIAGVPPESVPASEVAAVADAGNAGLKAGIERARADKAPVKLADIDSIRATLPQLLPGQQDDVLKAEQRFSNPKGYGMLFTNGTGTGKTFTGLGIIKRFARQGKTNTLIVVPDDKIGQDWIESARVLGLDVSLLKSKKDAGQGIVITSYANQGDNAALATRQWDLVVMDEAHTLLQNEAGEPTIYLNNLRAITHHPDGVHERYSMLHQDKIDAAAKLVGKTYLSDAEFKQLESANAELDKLLRATEKEVSAKQGADRARLVALSATPFAYEKTVDWAQGYLFDYRDGYPHNENSTQYNKPSPKQYFMQTRFGYSMKTNKLNRPSAQVDSGMMQRQFNSELKKAGALSGRMLEVAPDYDRRFVLVDSAIGNEIDRAIAWLDERAKLDPKTFNPNRVMRKQLGEALYGKDGYLLRQYLLEAIKAKEVVPIVQSHLALGRKIVVFHDYKSGGATNPFKFKASFSDEAETQKWEAASAEFSDQFPLLTGKNSLDNLHSPIVQFRKNFPDALIINGDEKKSALPQRYKKFQDDASGPLVMLVQSAKNKGWSGHDATGKNQRVLINLGQPTAPTLAIQQEGRIYRTGQASDAIMRYLNTGTSWERLSFASTIAARASTAENLGMGEAARALKDSFIQAFEESDTFPAGHEGEGKGGKERDKAANNALTEYDRAKALYWANQKKTSRTKVQEGADYFATPEPLGLKMVQWLDARNGEDVLEPSGGHGAIARWFPEKTSKTVIEPSMALRSRLALAMNTAEDRIIDGTFEDHAIVNKYDGIAMNPPFGTAGRTAVDHIAKAAQHLRDGGRIVALLPVGSADAKFDKWFYEANEKPIKPLATHPTLGDIFKGDTVSIPGSSYAGSAKWVVETAKEALNERITAVKPTGKRVEVYRPAANLHVIADIKLPSVTFERAGTAVSTRIVILEKQTKAEQTPTSQRDIDLSDITEIDELFGRLENLAMPPRPKVDPVEAEDAKAPGKAAKPAKAEKPMAELGATVTLDGKPYKVTTYTTNGGKVLRGVWVPKKPMAERFGSTFQKRGEGWFVREANFPAQDAAPAPAAPTFSRATTQTKGMTAAQVQAIAEKISAGWTNAPRIVVAANMADERIPQAARDEDQRQRATGATGSPEGFVHDGVVYLLADQLANPERAATVLIHEALGHIGLQGVFGDSLKTILQQVATMRQADIKAKAKQYGLDMSDPAQRLQAAEEVLAEMAQSRPEIGFVKRAVAAIRNWLRANVPGFRSLALTDADIVQQFILPARRYVTDGVSRDSGRSAATSPSLNKSNSDEFIADSALANSKIFPNFSNGKAFAKKGFGGLDIPTQRVVLARVISAMQDLEIADSVISLLPINMVNVLTGEKLPTKVVFHDQSMLINLLSAIRDDAIPLTVDSSTALIKAAAHNIAKRGGIFPKSAWPSGNGFSALGTNNGRPLIYSKGSLAFDSAKVVNRPSSLVGVTGEDGAAMGAIDSVHDDIVQQVRGWVERGRVAVSGGNTPMFSRSPAAANTAWATPEKSEWFDDLTYKLQDKQIDTKRVIEAIRTASGALADERNVYLQESLYHGRAAARSEDFVNKELGPLVNAMRMRGLDIAALDEYLHARHAEEANKLIAGRNPDIPDGGSGMTTADARAYLAGLDAGQRAKLEAVATQVDAILAKTRQLYADYSLESQKTVDGWSAMFAHYVPLMREDDSGGVGIGQGFSIKGRETRSRTGSTRKVVDILANIAMQRERAIIRGEKNRVATALVGLAEANPNKEFWHTGPPPSEKVYDAKLNKVVSRPDPMYKSRENVLMAKIKKADGTVIEKAVVFNEDNERAMRMSAALKNLDAAHLEGLLGVSAKVTRYFSAVNTQFNPIFGVVNLVRDVQSAILNLSSTPLKGKGVQVASHVFSALNGVYQDARAARNGQTPNSPWAALHEEFRQEGGQTGFRDAFTDSNDRANAIRRELNPGAWMDSPLGKIFTAGGALKVPLAIAQKRATGLFGWLSDYNLAMENAVRLSAYKVAREQGMSKQQAASLAKELTVNFNRKGQVGSQAGALYAFFNASMQGTARLGETLFSMEPGKPKTLRLSATGRNIVLGGVTLGVMQALLLSAAGFDDEEPPDFVRERSLIIPTGWLAGPDKGYITIPMPLGLHVLPNMGRIPTEFALNGFKNPEKQTARLFSIITGAFNPVGGGASLLQTLAPTAIDPLAALAENKDWTGKNIAKTSRNPATPGHLLTKDTASYPAKLLAEAINVMSGGTEYVAGVLSPTPDQIDYLWSQATGGVGREVSKAQQSVSTVFSGEDLPINKIPLAGRFYGNADTPSAQSNKFYSAIDRLNRHEEQIKGLRKNGRGAEVAAYLAENPDARLFMAANAAERQVQNLRTEKHKLLKKDAPAERVRLIEGQIAKRMTAFNELVQRTAR